MNDIEKLTRDFTQVITFKIVTTIKNHYGSLGRFKAACGSGSNAELARYNKNFHVDSKVLQALTRRGGRRNLDEVLSRLNPEELVYKHKFDWKYKSGKKFSKPSTFYIPFKRLEALFAAADDPERSPFDTNSEFYTADQHRLIDKYVLGFGKKERRPYTKSEKFRDAVAARTAAGRREELRRKDFDELDDADIEELVAAVEL